MTTIGSGEPVKPAGRPRRFGRGRVNATVRFSPERYAKLKAAADAAGRSVSEQNEFLIEDHERLEKIREEYERKAAEIAASVDRLADRYEAGLARLEKLFELHVEQVATGERAISEAQRIADKLEKARGADNERIAEVVATALAQNA